MNKIKKTKKVMDDKKKKYIYIGIIIILVMLILLVWLYWFLSNKEIKVKAQVINNSNETIESVLVDKTFDEQKNALLEILDEEINNYNNICLDNDNEECITEEEKEEILANLESLKEKVNLLESAEEVSNVSVEISDYLNSLKPVDVEEETESSSSSSSSNKGNSSSSSSSSSYAPSGSIESILNSAKLNPTKTGYPTLDNYAISVLNSVTNDSMSTYEKVKAVYDWIINNMSYQLGFVIGEEIDSLINTYGFYEKDAVQVFLATNGFGTHKGSCDNYSAMFVVLTRRIGLESYPISAITNAGGGHTTVNIKINGKWYNFDPQREDNSLKNGKITYLAFGEDDNDSKPYKYINRNSDVASFHGFQKQPESNYLKATITIAGKSYTAKTAVSSYKYVIPDTFEIDYATTPTTYINIEANNKVNYIHTMSDNTATNYVWETVSGDRGTINTNGTISITQKWGALRYEIIHLEDEKGRELNFVVRVNYRDPNKQFTIEQQVADLSYTDYVDYGVSTRDSVGEVTLSGKVIETNDPKGADAIVVGDSPFYDLRVSNLDRTKYYYVVEITGVDEAGNVAKDTVRIEVKS
mgnify:FL=1